MLEIVSLRCAQGRRGGNGRRRQWEEGSVSRRGGWLAIEHVAFIRGSIWRECGRFAARFEDSHTE